MRPTSNRDEMPLENRLAEQYRNMEIFASMKDDQLVEYYFRTISSMIRSAKPVLGDAQRDSLLQEARTRYENSLLTVYGRETPYHPVTGRMDRALSRQKLKVVKM